MGTIKGSSRTSLAAAFSRQLSLPGFVRDEKPVEDVKRALCGLPASREAVFRVLRAHATANAIAYPSQQRIALLTKLSVRTVIRSIAELRAIGAIVDVYYDRQLRRRTRAAYALHRALLSPNCSAERFARKLRTPSSRLVCDISNQQTTRARARAVLELTACGVTPVAARSDVARIGAELVLRRIAQAKSRPAIVRGEVRSLAAYVRHCVTRAYPPPPPRSKVLVPLELREMRRRWAIAMQLERDREREKRESAIGAAAFMAQLRRRFA